MSKKILLLFFISFFNFGISQQYKFNLLTNYSVNGGEYNNIVFSNSENQTYFLKVIDIDKAILIDSKTKYIYNFSYQKDLETNQLEKKFKYVSREKLWVKKFAENYTYTSEIIKEDSIYKTLLITRFKNKTEKLNSLELKVRNAKNNFYPLFFFSTSHHSALVDIDLGDNYIIESSTSNNNKNDFSFQLDLYVDADFTINIPK